MTLTTFYKLLRQSRVAAVESLVIVECGKDYKKIITLLLAKKLFDMCSEWWTQQEWNDAQKTGLGGGTTEVGDQTVFGM